MEDRHPEPDDCFAPTLHLGGSHAIETNEAGKRGVPMVREDTRQQTGLVGIHDQANLANRIGMDILRSGSFPPLDTLEVQI